MPQTEVAIFLSCCVTVMHGSWIHSMS